MRPAGFLFLGTLADPLFLHLIIDLSVRGGDPPPTRDFRRVFLLFSGTFLEGGAKNSDFPLLTKMSVFVSRKRGGKQTSA